METEITDSHERLSVGDIARTVAIARRYSSPDMHPVSELREARRQLIERFGLKNSACFVIKDLDGGYGFLGVIVAPDTSELHEEKDVLINLTSRPKVPEKIGDFSYPRNVGGAQHPEFL